MHSRGRKRKGHADLVAVALLVQQICSPPGTRQSKRRSFTASFQVPLSPCITLAATDFFLRFLSNGNECGCQQQRAVPSSVHTSTERARQHGIVAQAARLPKNNSYCAMSDLGDYTDTLLSYRLMSLLSLILWLHWLLVDNT